MFSTLAPNVLPIRVPFARQLELAHAFGFDALDLPMKHFVTGPRAWSPGQVGEMYAVHELRCGGWQLPFNYEGGDGEFAAGLKLLPRAARLARALASPWCFSWIEPSSDELDLASNTARYVKRLRAMADVLGDHDCRLGLEFIGPKTLRVGHRFDFVHTLEGALDLFAAVDRPNMGLLLDCFHWYTSHGSVAELTALTASQVVYVHINDAVPEVEVDEQLDDVRLLPGESGVIDISAFLEALDTIGYSGPVAVEPFSAAVAAAPARDRVGLAASSLHSVFAATGLQLGHHAGANGHSRVAH